MKETILFDLGNTLVSYYDRSEFPDILKQAILEVQTYLVKEKFLAVSSESIWQRVKEENYEARDYSVRPLEGRLMRIFQLEPVKLSYQTIDNICRCFMKPIFATARRYDDALPVLEELGARKIKRFIVSNTPWGCPANLWHEELIRHSLSDHIESAFFCRDAGWRKPARQIFDFVLKKISADPQDCLFVGDDPRWDLIGPENVGMDAIIIDHKSEMQDKDGTISSLYEILDYFS